MRARVVFWTSLGVNVALGAALVYFWPSPRPARRVPGLRGAPAAGAPSNAPPRIIPLYRKQFFSWREIESPDYPTYINNLRSIDCPEATIRDIIVADVNQLYNQKKAKLLVTGDQQWWRSVPDLDVLQTNMDKLQALEEERRALLTKLLGPNWESAPESGSPTLVDLGGPVLGQLSPEAKATVQQLTARAQQRQNDYVAAQRQAGKPADPAELARLRQQTREELAQVLDPAQLEEYLLRYSSAANNLRKDLTGFEVSPEEFRQLYRIRDPIEQQIDLYYAGDDPVSAKRRQDLKNQEEAAVKQALGPDRYQALVLAQDPAYQDAKAAAQQFGAPPDKVLPVYQVNQLAAAEQRRIQNDPTLTPDERDKALQLVLQEKEKSIRQILSGAPPSSTPAPPPVPANSPPLPEGLGRP